MTERSANGRTSTVDLVLTGLDGPAEPVHTCLMSVFSLSRLESEDLLRQVLAGDPVTIYQDLSESEVDARITPLERVGARVARRVWHHPDPCDVVLVATGPNRINVIQHLCNPDAGYNLGETITILERVPVVVRKNLHRKEAELLRAALVSVGAHAMISESPAKGPPAASESES